MGRIYRIQCVSRRTGYTRDYFHPAYFDNKREATTSLGKWVDKNMDDCSVQVFRKGPYGSVGQWHVIARGEYGVTPKRGAQARRRRKRMGLRSR